MMDHTKQFMVYSNDLLILLPCLRSFFHFDKNLIVDIFYSIQLGCFELAFLREYDFGLSSFLALVNADPAIGSSFGLDSYFEHGFFLSFSMLVIMAIC